MKISLYFLVVWLALTGAQTVAHGQNAAAPAPSAGAETSEKSAASQPDPCLSDPDCALLAFRARAMSGAGEHEAALLAYQSAFARRPVPWLLVNIGRLQQKLGRLDEAIITYRKFYNSEGLKDPALRVKARAFVAQALDDLATKPGLTDLPPKEISEPPPVGWKPEGSATENVSHAAAVVSVRPAVRPESPACKKRWFWGLMGGALVGAIGIGIGIGIGVQRATSPPFEILRPSAM